MALSFMCPEYVTLPSFAVAVVIGAWGGVAVTAAVARRAGVVATSYKQKCSFLRQEDFCTFGKKF